MKEVVGLLFVSHTFEVHIHVDGEQEKDNAYIFDYNMYKNIDHLPFSEDVCLY
jgi:6-pyruvoyl-tetrahydropterin synthase